jgi:hypothetical protein
MSIFDKYAHKVIMIGKLKLTLPSLITLVCGAVIATVFAIKISPIMGLGVMLPFLLATYNVNCTVVGHCSAWAMVLALFYVVYTLSVLMLVVFVKPSSGMKNIDSMKKIKK